MRRVPSASGSTVAILAAVVALGVLAAMAAPQEPTPASVLTFNFAGRSLKVPQMAMRVELMPVLHLLGAQASYSPAAGTYAVVYNDHLIQFAPDRYYVLVDNELRKTKETPRVSPGGVATSVEFLERVILSPLGFHLEPVSGGYDIAAGAIHMEPLSVRADGRDDGGMTTLVLRLEKAAGASVDQLSDGSIMVTFAEHSPRLDSSGALRSDRVGSLTVEGRNLHLDVAPGVGLRRWHNLDDPPRIVLELWPVQATPTPTPPPAAGTPVASPPQLPRPANQVRPIVIDPGHGGDDFGAVAADGVMEKNLVLEIARRLASVLNRQGHAARLTRTRDESRALSDRAAIANRYHARVFVSLHANASKVRAVRGAETYYISLDQGATDAAAAAIAEAENRAGETKASQTPLDLILWDLAQAEVLNESAELALAVQLRLNNRLGLRDRGVKQAPFVVLTGATMPAILVEVGFLSNAEEARRLRSPDHQQRVAEAIALGIQDFLDGS